MKEEILVYKPGADVVLRRIQIEGSIIGVVIGPGSVFYEVGYFDNGKYIVGKFYDFEFSISASTEKQTIGFIKQ